MVHKSVDYFLIQLLVYKMSENGEMLFSKAQNDVLRCLVLSTNQKIFSFLSQKQKIFTFNELESQNHESMIKIVAVDLIVDN